ncbi:MAG: hypothetical protein R2857_01210 [Vampirovibrionales bacterium]
MVVNYIEKSPAVRLNPSSGACGRTGPPLTANGLPAWPKTTAPSKVSYDPDKDVLTVDGKEVKDGDTVEFKSNLKARTVVPSFT